MEEPDDTAAEKALAVAIVAVVVVVVELPVVFE